MKLKSVIEPIYLQHLKDLQYLFLFNICVEYYNQGLKNVYGPIYGQVGSQYNTRIWLNIYMMSKNET